MVTPKSSKLRSRESISQSRLFNTRGLRHNEKCASLCIMSSSEKSRILNFNVGVLGHIDSGKTSLSKVLSTTASTASFDKNPQSRERGITLDLGFSSFAVQLPEQLKEEPYDILQFTLVDCPGHASLIKTIIGGAQIIDLMILVVDINKGIQTQTAECLIIGQITCDKMIVVLNKIDLIPEAKRVQQIEKMKKRLSKTLESTKFSGSPIVAVAAKPDGGDVTQIEALGVQELADLLSSQAYVPKRNTSGPFLFAVDHCFSVRGQGTVMTGTILQGSVALNDNIEIPSMKVVKKVKSIQMFRQPVVKAFQGDRVGICVTQFDPKLLERGLVCTPSTVPTIVAGIMSVEKIHYYKTAVSSKAKFHITVGHETVMGKAQFFGLPASENPDAAVGQKSSFDFSKEYVFQEELLGISKEKDKEKENSFPENPTQNVNPNFQFAVLELEKPVTCPHESLVIGSRLDTDIHLNTCRLAFHGKLLNMITEKSYDEVVLPKLRIFKNKSRVGEVERVVDEYSVVGKGLFKKETNIQLFLNLKVTLSTGETGVIEGSFGQSGKFKVRIPAGLSPETFNSLSAFHKKKGKGKPATATGDEKEKASPVKIILNFKRYVFDPEKRMIQT